MKPKFTCLVFSVLFASTGLNIAFQEKVNAWLDMCNRGTTPITRLAVGYFEDGSWKSDGWWSMKKGECRRVYEKDLENSKKTFLYYVEGQGWGNRAQSSFCIATNRNFTFYSSQIGSRCGQPITLSTCTFGPNGEGCSNIRTTYYTKLVNVSGFDTSGRNFTLNLTN